MRKGYWWIGILFCFLFSTQLYSAEFTVTSKIQANPAHLGLQRLDDGQKYDLNGNLCALLIVRCGIEDILFVNSVSKVAQIDKAGEYWVTMKAGARYITLRKSGFGNYKEQFGMSLESGCVYEMSVDQKGGDGSLIPVLITCNEDEAEVWVDNQKHGKIQTNKLTINLSNETHKIRVQKAGFGPQSQTAVISLQNNAFDFQLAPAMPATVDIRTEPEGATVYIDNILFGTTPKQSFFEAGTYPIRIEKENYAIIEKEITIIEPETHRLYELTDIRATLTVKTNPAATVTINGKEYSGSVDALKIRPQTVTITVTQPYCETLTETITLVPQETKILELYPEDRSAYLAVHTDDKATVMINETRHQGSVENLRLEAQVVSIRVEMNKAETIERVFTLKPNAHETLELYPQVKAGTISVAVIPADAQIKLNGDAGEHFTAIGRHTFADIPIGKYELMVKADGYKSHKEILQLAENATLPKQIQLEEGSDIPEGFVFIEGGIFEMGNDSKDEKPVHNVQINDFYMGQYEVTQAEWLQVMGDNPSRFRGDCRPVERVNWYEAVEFCNQKSIQDSLEPCYDEDEGKLYCHFDRSGYRLPTEAEWEYAARCGASTNSTMYSGSDTINEVAWHAANSDSQTQDVGSKAPNTLGLYDLSGNVWEWCWDWYEDKYYYRCYHKNMVINPTGPSDGTERVWRGGSWNGNADACRITNRSHYDPDFRSHSVGLRLVRGIEPSK